jgi:NAD(P)-dependent dehydrogenase (short-subunit alcohol dehydrogenase family)
VNAVALDYGSLDPKFEVYPQESITKLRAMMAIGRLGKPEDVVGPILFLLSPDSGFITGEILGVGGGLYMR